MKLLWNAAGLALVGLGIAGAILPLLPSVVFFLGAAFCFARGSERLHDWLVTHPRFGPPIEDWRRYRAIRRPAKVLAMGAIALSFLASLALGATAALLAVQGAVLAMVSVFILTRPEGPEG